MNILDFVACALAANSVVTAWFYGSIFERFRAYFEGRGGLLGELFGCLLCFPYHAAFWTVALLWLPGTLAPEPWATVLRLPLYAFALTTVIHYMQGVLPVKEEEVDDPRQGGHDDSEAED
jgi:hypothetical protein